jgi:Fe-S-cluster containining protein
MNLEILREKIPLYRSYFERLADVFRQMDRGYADVSAHYGFVCSGCENSCCRTRFYHHTLIEYGYLTMGFDALPESERHVVHARAVQTNAYWMSHAESGPESMCPLNVDGRCLLYPYRPMICRLHGIPHELNHPVRGKTQGPGCHEFARNCGAQTYIPFDRTPLYRELAALEKSFRIETGITAKIKMTVAEILVDHFRHIPASQE